MTIFSKHPRLAIFIAILIAALAITVYGTISYHEFLRSPLIPAQEKPFDYVLQPGTSVRKLADDWQQQNILRQPFSFLLLAYTQGFAHKLKAGEYLFAPGSTPRGMLEKMAAGKVIFRHFSLIEGWNFQQVLRALRRNEFAQQTFTGEENYQQILARLNISARSPEGLFFPDTYQFTRGTTDVALLQRAHRILQWHLQQAWTQRTAGLPYKTPYEALIAASLIEKETARPEEYKLIAGVIARRLQINMPLQIDSAIIYGLGENYNGHLSRDDLRLDTPYNTYLHKGLPPTPIAMPSLAALHAALHPLQTDALYFVAKGNGGHQFSATLAAHNKAVNTFQVAIHLPYIGRKRYNLDCEPARFISVRLQDLLHNSCQLKF